jgi:hypothetical protein
MSEVDDLLTQELKTLPPKPPEGAAQSDKKRYSELMSAAAARALGETLRRRGLRGALPTLEAGPKLEMRAAGRKSGVERRMDGALGAKKVDVTWATEESGLLLALSIKTINFKDGKTSNYQKNLTNRRSDMLFESTTLHRRFPYSTLGGFFFLDVGAKNDGTAQRRSTFQNAHRRLKMFTGRSDPAGRPEQYERLYIVLVEAAVGNVVYEVYRAGDPETQIALDQALIELLEIVAERSPDFYDVVGGKLVGNLN